VQSKFLFDQVAQRVGDMRPSLIGLVDVASEFAGNVGFPDHLLKVLAEFVAARDLGTAGARPLSKHAPHLIQGSKIPLVLLRSTIAFISPQNGAAGRFPQIFTAGSSQAAP